MRALYLTIFISLLLAIIFLIFFIHSMKTGQYEDAYSPSVRALFDDDEIIDKSNEGNSHSKHDKNNNN